MDIKKFKEDFLNAYRCMTDDQKKRTLACKTVDDFIEMAKAETEELGDDVLDQISAGFDYEAERSPQWPVIAMGNLFTTSYSDFKSARDEMEEFWNNMPELVVVEYLADSDVKTE